MSFTIRRNLASKFAPLTSAAVRINAADWRDPSDPNGVTIRVDPTGVIDSTAAWAALIAQYTASGEPVIIDHPPGSYVGSVAPITVNTIGFVGPGSRLMMINAPVGFTGDVMNAIPTAFDDTHRTSPPIGGFTIDGANAAPGAVGLHYGPHTGADIDLVIQNFTDNDSTSIGGTSIGAWFDLTNPFYAAGNAGAVAWTERTKAHRIHTGNCDTHVLFDGGDDSYSGYFSFDYTEWWFSMGGWKPGARGLHLTRKCEFAGAKITLMANVKDGGGTSTEGLIVMDAFTQIDGATLHIAAEQNGGTPVPCMVIDSTAIFTGHGLLRFHGLADAILNGYHPRFTGWVQVPGLNGVTNSYLLSRKVPPLQVDSGFYQSSAAGTFPGVPAPVNAGDPPRQQDVPSLPAVKAVATTALSLSGLPLIGSYQTQGNDRVLLTAESTQSHNGPWLIPTVNGTLSSDLSTGGAITTVPMTAITVAIASGAQVTLDDGAGHTQVLNVTSSAAVGATSLSVLSFTPNFAYPSASTVVRFPWSRPPDFPSGSTNNGRTVLCGDGSLWGLITTSPITVDTSSQTWKLLAGATAYNANHRTTDFSGIGTTPVVVLTTGSLAVGTWKIDAHVSVTQNGSPTLPKTAAVLGAGSATATFDGASSDEIMLNSTTLFEGTLHISAVAVVTVAGTLTISVTCSSATCTARAATVSTSAAGATGYVATQLA